MRLLPRGAGAVPRGRRPENDGHTRRDRLLVRHRLDHDFVIHAHEQFRLPKLLGKPLGKLVRQVCEIILAESDDKEISRDNVINITVRIAQRTVERQTIQLSRLAANLA